MIDANNLYRGIIEKFRLPISTIELIDESKWTNECEKEISQRILNTLDDNNVRFIIEVDIS